MRVLVWVLVLLVVLFATELRTHPRDYRDETSVIVPKQSYGLTNSVGTSPYGPPSTFLSRA
jgi:hypothetical protein